MMHSQKTYRVIYQNLRVFMSNSILRSIHTKVLSHERICSKHRYDFTYLAHAVMAVGASTTVRVRGTNKNVSMVRNQKLLMKNSNTILNMQFRFSCDQGSLIAPTTTTTTTTTITTTTTFFLFFLRNILPVVFAKHKTKKTVEREKQTTSSVSVPKNNIVFRSVCLYLFLEHSS